MDLEDLGDIVEACECVVPYLVGSLKEWAEEGALILISTSLRMKQLQTVSANKARLLCCDASTGHSLT